MTCLGSSGGWLGFIKTTKRNGKKKKKERKKEKESKTQSKRIQKH